MLHKAIELVGHILGSSIDKGIQDKSFGSFFKHFFKGIGFWVGMIALMFGIAMWSGGNWNNDHAPNPNVKSQVEDHSMDPVIDTRQVEKEKLAKQAEEQQKEDREFCFESAKHMGGYSQCEPFRSEWYQKHNANSSSN